MIRGQKLATIGLPLVLATIALGVYTYKRAHSTPAYTLANGVEVTPIEVQPDDVGKLLETKIWKFDVVWPRHQGHFRAGISLYQDGKFAKALVGGLGMGSRIDSQPSQITVGLVPMGGTIFEAKQLRYSLSTGGSTSEVGTIPNPFLHAHGYTEDMQVVRAQNLVILVSGNLKKTWISTPASMNETAIVLELTEGIPSK